MQAIPGLVELEPVSLASLEPSINPKSEITATVASLWPYSSSALKLTAIIVELDYRKRENRGELKVSFHGYAAESLKALAIGDVVKISLEGATWEELPEPEERDVPWQLKWEKRLRVRIFKDISATDPKIEVDGTFDQAHRSGILDRIAAAEAIINESQHEQNEEDFGTKTPLKHSQLPASWSTSFRDSIRGGSQTPINIFAQGRRRLFSLDSDDEEDDIDADRMRKKPRIFEPHQSFRYVSDSPENAEEEREDEHQFSKQTENQFFDENSFRDSFRGGESAPTPKLYVRPDDAGDISVEGQSHKASLGDKSRGTKLYVRPDKPQPDDISGSPAHSITPQAIGERGTKREATEINHEIFQIIFGEQAEPQAAAPQTDEDEIFSRSLTEFTSQDTFPTRLPLESQGISSTHISADPLTERSTTPPYPSEQSTTPPFPPQQFTAPQFTTERSFTPPFPETLRPTEVDSQPMSSFTLDASQASRPIANEMPPPASQPHSVPRLDTLFSGRSDPITPVLKPTASPALPLPSPFPSSALEKGTVSFFPSRLSQSFASSETEDAPVKSESEQTEAHAVGPETVKAAFGHLEERSLVEGIKSESEDMVSSGQKADTAVEKVLEIKRDTITVVKHGVSLVDPESPQQHEVLKAEEPKTKESRHTAKASQPEVIEILDSSDEEEEEGEEEEEEDEEEDEDDDDDDDDDEGEDGGEYYEEEDEYEEEYNGEPGQGGRGPLEHYEEGLAAENDEEDYYVEEDGYPPADESLQQRDPGQTPIDEDEMEYKYHQPTPSPDIEERESPFVSDDDEPAREYRSPKVGESLISSRGSISYISASHRTVGIKTAISRPSEHRQGTFATPSAPALHGAVFSHPQQYTSSESPTPTTPTANQRLLSHTETSPQAPGSPEPYVPQSPSSPPSQPRTPNLPQTKPSRTRTPTLEDNGFEFVEGPVHHTVSPAIGVHNDTSSQMKQKRTLPWLTPQVAPKHKHHDDILGPNTAPNKLRTPAADTKIALKEMVEAARKLRSQDSTRKPILKPKLDINPDAIRKFREYNAACGISGGIITPLSEFVSVQKLLRIEWEKNVDILAVNLREGEVTQYKNPPNFFELKVWVIDPSCSSGKPVLVILKRPYQAALPKTVKPGDVILLRDIKIKSQDNQRCGFSTMTSGWKLWRPRRAPDGRQQMVSIPHDGPNAECGAEEIFYVNSLWEWWKGIDVDIRVYLMNKKERGPRKGEVTNA
ncbi:hypothetical protein TWF730_009426 [Orbilia blumenaviensis]|uniref:Telomeric single stranded DNA binding POT1/Cdc13 domain-containing protein n=1 Tax=Orbilia blumenaviensis TaxID=1796055 RepID=A0AAV9V292_9PEZI